MSLAMRAVEAGLFKDAAEEVDHLYSLLPAEDLIALRRAIATYHNRRQRAAPDLLVASRPTGDER